MIFLLFQVRCVSLHTLLVCAAVLASWRFAAIARKRKNGFVRGRLFRSTDEIVSWRSRNEIIGPSLQKRIISAKQNFFTGELMLQPGARTKPRAGCGRRRWNAAYGRAQRLERRAIECLQKFGTALADVPHECRLNWIEERGGPRASRGQRSRPVLAPAVLLCRTQR